MSARIALESSTLDTLDAQITRALQISPRVAFAELAEILDVAEQTVARRYRRMRRDGYLRVTMTADLHGTAGANWLVRVRCRPEGADTIAHAVAARDDVSWVSIYGAGWEVDFNLRARADVETHELLHEMLPRSAPILDVAPAEILHTYIGGAGDHQDTWSDVLTSAQTAALRATAPAVVSSKGVRAELDEIDCLLIDELGRDGRVSYSTLARTAGSTPGKVTRRVERLIGSGVAYFHVDLATAAIGLRSTALWLTVVPRSLASVGQALGTDTRIPFAAAVTGRANLTANVIGAGRDDLYSFVTEDLARLDGITGYELVPLLRRVKHAGALVHGDKLAPPQISPNRRRASSRSVL